MAIDRAKAPKPLEAAGPRAAKPSWLEREVAGEFIIAPLVRGTIWVFLHAVLLIKRLLLP
ncbi:MAG: hypothetical protein ACFB13_21595 [Kiloniellaceae bacterium]